MIGRLIAASARNLMLVLIGTVFAVTAGLYAVFLVLSLMGYIQWKRTLPRARS